MFIVLTVTLGDSRYSYGNDKKAEITAEGDLVTLHVLANSLGIAAGAGGVALIDAELKTQAAAQTAETITEEE